MKINLSMETPLTDRCDLCMEKFGFLAACKHFHNATEIKRRLHDQGIKTKIETVSEFLFHVVLI